MQQKIVVLSQFDGSVKLLKIDLETCHRKIVPSKDVDENEIAFGFFEVEETAQYLDSVALVATPEGPLLILRDTRYYPSTETTEIQINDDAKSSSFLVFHEGRKIFELTYEAKFGIGLHPYNNSRADIDFYFWLSANIKSSGFYEKYTRDLKHLR